MPEAELHSGRKVWRFDEMVVMVNDRIDNPSEANVDRYVGLEHLDSDSLKIRRWGNTTDVEATKLLFRSGDIIFGRRRVYQRKLAVADFDGICSAHAMVLRARPEVVLPVFLPFFMQSGTFMERALEISVGSLSPTINWKTLAKEEFALPPLDEQRRIAELLQASESVRQRLHSAVESVDQAISGWFSSRLTEIADIRLFGDLLNKTEYGISERANTDRDGVPILRIPNILRGMLDLSDLKWVPLSDEQVSKYALNTGDILMVRTNGNPDYVGRCLVVPQLNETTVFASYLIRIIVDASKIRPEFAVSVLNSPDTRRLLRGSVRSSAGNFNINTKGIRSVPVPAPPLKVQDSILAELATFRNARSSLVERQAIVSVMRRVALKRLER